VNRVGEPVPDGRFAAGPGRRMGTGRSHALVLLTALSFLFFAGCGGQGLVFCHYLSPVSAAWNFASAITSTTDSPARMAAAIAS
jgi:hypothetical protein